MKSNFLETPRLTYHYRSQGDPDGPPILLLHGEFATGRWWEPFLEVLPTELCAIAPDLRGCGQTLPNQTPYTIEDFCDDLDDFVTQMNLRAFDLVAHSGAGAIAIEYTLRNQHKLESLTLVDSVPIEGVHTPLDTLHLLAQMKEEQTLLAQAIALTMPTIFPPALLEDLSQFSNQSAPYDYAQSRFFEQVLDDVSNMAPPLYTAFAEALSQWNRFGDAHALTLPTLVVWGDQDTIVSQDEATRTLIAIPGAANLEILRGVGHSPMIEAPLRLAERIIDFITSDHDHFGEIRQSV